MENFRFVLRKSKTHGVNSNVQKHILLHVITVLGIAVPYISEASPLRVQRHIQNSAQDISHYSSSSSDSLLIRQLLPQGKDHYYRYHEHSATKISATETNSNGDDDDVTYKIQSPQPAEYIPDYFKAIVVFNTSTSRLHESTVQKLRWSFSKQIGLPVENIRVSHVAPQKGTVEMYFVYTIVNDDIIPGRTPNRGLLVFIPPLHVLRQISISQLKNDVAPSRIIDIRTKESKEMRFKMFPRKDDVKAWNIFKDHMWGNWQLPVIISSTLLAIFVCILLLLFLTGHKEMKYKNDSYIENPQPQQVIYQPVMKPPVNDVQPIQPERKDSYITETESDQTLSPCKSPMHVKTKRLLERRGSNASLTLDLSHSEENINQVSPPKECSAEEYLLSAGHRMTRKQLRNCLKDVKALHTEFWEIPMNHPEKVEIPGSGTKNRYKTIVPNEKTRVQLHSESDSDQLSGYINANYIRGYDGEPKEYIATQGPMPHTINDFWRMIWQEKSPVIVMITKLREKNKVKCELYLPETSGIYGDIEVSVARRIQRDGYTIRELFVKHDNEIRQIFHFWYNAWPDHKAPHTGKQLLAVALEVEALRRDNNGVVKGPTIVHCSAGIGRTGCFISISIGIQQLLEENMADVLGIVCQLRLDRGGMVQTAEQYEFVHQALVLFERTLPEQHSGT